MDKLAINNPGQLMLQMKQYNTPAKCASSDTPALSVLKKENGESQIIDVIQLWISNCNDFFNLARKMAPAQIKETAIMILDDFYYLKIADINLVFTRAKKGYFGEMYQSLDGAKVYHWFDQYANERAETLYRDNLKQHDIIKANE